MSGNVFGDIFRFMTFGESHGTAVGVVIDGVTPGLELVEEDIQRELDRRRPGQSDVTTPRRESDRVVILSGVFEGKTTGTPVGLILYNENARSEDYDAIKDLFRPGHADFSYGKKYGIRDYRGSGRASGRETAARVAAGAVAKKVIGRLSIHVTAYTLRAAGIQCNVFDPDEIERNAMRAPDKDAAPRMAEAVMKAAAEGESVGGIVECRVTGVPAGLGDPVFDKLDACLAKAILSLGAVKGIEFGTGFKAADMTGSQHNDQLTPAGFMSNHAGGIIGGISTGQEIIFRAAVKPPSSISKEQKTIDVQGNPALIRTEGRHDPCICPRIVPVVEAMTAAVLADAVKKQAALHA